MEFTDSSAENPAAKKIAKVSQLVTRHGVIIKGERGIINPGEGGILRYDSEEIPTRKLYQQRQGDSNGKSVIVIKAPVNVPDNIKTLAILQALYFLRAPENLTAENLDEAKEAVNELSKLIIEDMPEGWKLQYVEALKIELEKRILTIIEQPSP